MRDPMNYGKAKGIMLLGKYLPQVTPFTQLDIVGTLAEYEEVKDKYGDFAVHRVDMPIGKSLKNAVAGTSGFANEIPALIEKVNQQDPEGVVLLLSTKRPMPPRYLYTGGFNASFTIGGELIIEFVGQGFDGHELTQGWAVHERYIVAWRDLPFVVDRPDLMQYAIERFRVSSDAYAKQRAERISFLVDDCHYDAATVMAHVPEQYDFLRCAPINRFLRYVVFELFRQQEKLARDGLYEFGVQGNFVGGHPEPWEIFQPERWH